MTTRLSDALIEKQATAVTSSPSLPAGRRSVGRRRDSPTQPRCQAIYYCVTVTEWYVKQGMKRDNTALRVLKSTTMRIAITVRQNNTDWPSRLRQIRRLVGQEVAAQLVSANPRSYFPGWTIVTLC